MNILGIETSCDETAAAVVKDGRKVLSSSVATSADMHIASGGIIPENAARKQIESIIPIIKDAIKKSGLSLNQIDKIAVTKGPGLIGSLLVGVETAKTLSLVWKKPIVPVNHMWGHIYATWLLGKSIEFPAVVLIVSGGHSDLVLMEGHGKAKWIGGTRDDAAGEAFDKTARLIDLPYPGGPNISKEAEKFKGNNELDLFPRPMIDTKDFDFSFSGLKTAVANYLKSEGNKKLGVERLSAEIQEAIVDVLLKKTLKAVKKYNPKSLIVSGGVAANKRLREKLEREKKKQGILIETYIPEVKYCTDNAAMIAACANYMDKPRSIKNISANPQLTIT